MAGFELQARTDMGAWDEDSDEDEGTQWPSEEQDIDHEEEAYMDDVYGWQSIE